MQELFGKIKKIKQKRCISAIKVLNNEQNIYIYNTGRNFIKYHEDFLDIYGLQKPLTNIKKHYIKDLKEKKSRLRNATDEEKQQLLSIIEGDMFVIDELTDDFINKYNELAFYVRYIKKNKKYLTEEQEIEYLFDFYKLTNNNLEYDMLRVRCVNKN